eukprot:UN07273
MGAHHKKVSETILPTIATCSISFQISDATQFCKERKVLRYLIQKSSNYLKLKRYGYDFLSYKKLFIISR